MRPSEGVFPRRGPRPRGPVTALRFAFPALVLLAIAALVGGIAAAERLVAPSPQSPPISIPVRFTDVREAAGITWQQDATASDQKYYLETMGTGLGWIDYDQDGLLDLYLVQSAATDIYKPPRPLHSALYRNNGDGTFTDVTGKAGVGAEGLYGQGVAVGDFDNDGYPDLYVTGYGRSILYHNNGNGTFTDVTEKAGVANLRQWGASAGWFDYDKDGWLDLVVCNYIEWSPKNNIWCGEHRPGYRAYCHPDNYKGQRIKLFHNNHDGTFTDVSEKSGVGVPEAKGMGVVLADFNNDGWPDIAIANDTWPNFLFLNNHDGTLHDISFSSGIAASEDGKYEAGMGIDAADVEGDGWQALYVTHLDFELNRLYRNNRDETFDDVTFASGIGNKAIFLSGVSAKFMDYDNDGWNDINWLEVKLVGTKSNRDGIGAALKLVSEGVSQYEQSKGGMSYMSAHDPRIHFGLGRRKTVQSLEITWPSGTVEKLTNVPANQTITVKEGSGIVPGHFPKVPQKP